MIASILCRKRENILVPLFIPIDKGIVKYKNVSSRFKGPAHKMALLFQYLHVIAEIKPLNNQTLLGILAIEIKGPLYALENIANI